MAECDQHPNCWHFDSPLRGVAAEGCRVSLVADGPEGVHQLCGLDLVADAARLSWAVVQGTVDDRGLLPGDGLLIIPAGGPSAEAATPIWEVGPGMVPVILRTTSRVAIDVTPERELLRLALRVHVVAI